MSGDSSLVKQEIKNEKKVETTINNDKSTKTSIVNHCPKEVREDLKDHIESQDKQIASLYEQIDDITQQASRQVAYWQGKNEDLARKMMENHKENQNDIWVVLIVSGVIVCFVAWGVYHFQEKKIKELACKLKVYTDIVEAKALKLLRGEK